MEINEDMKEDAKFDEWRKDITPSKELRQWFHEDKDRHWEVFQGRYGMEIKQNPDSKQYDTFHRSFYFYDLFFSKSSMASFNIGR